MMLECMFDRLSQHPPTDTVKRISCDSRRPANLIDVPETQPSSRTGTLFQPMTLVIATRLSPSCTIA